MGGQKLTMYCRNIEKKIRSSLEESPAVLINGARQTGKSTLVKSMLGNTHKYYTLDDINILEAVKSDPIEFLDSNSQPIVIDEIQRCPELFLPLKKKIDDDRKAGQFVLTGSANVLGLPLLSESLAGRMEVHTMWPLAESEIKNKAICFIDRIFNDIGLDIKNNNCNYTEEIFSGGYPDVRRRSTEDKKDDWCHSYLQTLLYKDVRDLANIEKLTELPYLLSLLAARSSSLLNMSELSRSSGLPMTTMKRYLYILELLYLFIKIPAWSRNFSKRLVRSPKSYLNDVRLLLYLLGKHPSSILTNQKGQIVENFVATEIIKQQTWSKTKTRLFHFRTQAGQEIDFILESYDGRLVAIEVKASKKIDYKFFDHIKKIQEEIPMTGILLYMGDEVIKYGKNIWALPLSVLWS